MIFDLDGVLVDSRPGIVACINAVLRERGLEPFTSIELERVIGPPLREGFATLLAERGADLRDTAACVVRYRELYATASRSGGTILQPAVVPMLVALAERARLAVATSKPLRFAEPILADLDIAPYFARVTGPTLETDGEDKTATLRRALDDFRDVERSNVAMVGDRHHDVTAAVANGVVPIGAAWGYGDERELTAAGAVFIASDPSVLQSYFEAAWSSA